MKSRHAVALGQLGGRARAERLTPRRLSEIARGAAASRWGVRLPSLATVFALSDYYRETVVKTRGALKDDLILLTSVLRDTPHAIIGGIAIQPLRKEPRTTDDIDVAIPSLDLVPRA